MQELKRPDLVTWDKQSVVSQRGKTIRARAEIVERQDGRGHPSVGLLISAITHGLYEPYTCEIGELCILLLCFCVSADAKKEDRGKF